MKQIVKKITISKLALATCFLFSALTSCSWANTQIHPQIVSRIVAAKINGSEPSQYPQFKNNLQYEHGEVVSYQGFLYQTDKEVLADTFKPGMGSPWEKYAPLLTWNSEKIYYAGDMVVYKSIAYKAMYYTLDDDPSDKTNQNQNSNGRQWRVIGSWHNLTQNKISKIANFNSGFRYSKGDFVKFNNVVYYARTDTHDISPTQKNPWQGFVAWNDIKSKVVRSNRSWPEHVFSPYVDMLLYDRVPDFTDLKNRQGIDHFNMAFVVAKDPQSCIPTWGGVLPISEYDYSNINKLRRNGGDVMLSIGGAASTTLAKACQDVHQLAEHYIHLVDSLDLKALDFDIEGAEVADPDSIERRAIALEIAQRHWQSEHRNVSLWFTLPVLPSGLNNYGQNIVNSVIDHGINFKGINIMTMDYGDIETKPMDGIQCNPTRSGKNNPAENSETVQGYCAVLALKETEKFLKAALRRISPNISDDQVWSKLGTTPMIGVNDTTTEVLYPAGAKVMAKDAKEHHIGMVSMWSIARDQPTTNDYERDTANSNNGGLSPDQSSLYEFSKIFETGVANKE